MIKFTSANFKKLLSPNCIILRIQRVNSVDLDEVAQYEPPHQDLRYLKIQLFSSVVVKELNLPRIQSGQSSAFSKPVVEESVYVPFGHKIGSDVFSGQYE